MNLPLHEGTRRLRRRAAIRPTTRPPTESRHRRRRVHLLIFPRAHIRHPSSTGRTFNLPGRLRGFQMPTTATTTRGWVRRLCRRTAAAAERVRRALRALSRTATSQARGSGGRSARTRTGREGRMGGKVRPGQVENVRQARGPTTALVLAQARDQAQARVRGRRATKRRRPV